MTIVADMAQTFTVDSKAVNSKYCYISGIDLFFGRIPSSQRRPGATIYLTETTLLNNFSIPNLDSQVKYGKKRLEYDQIVNSTTGTSPTTFNFAVPVLIKTDTVYAFVIKFDFSDTNFALWRNKVGETFNQNQSTAVTSGALDGRFFIITNGTNITPDNDTDLKFTIRAQKFIKDVPYTFSAVGRNFEFININRNTLQGEFSGGELVFTNIPAPTSQTISVSTTSKVVTGSNTKFQINYRAGDPIILKSGNVYSIQTVNNVVSNTSLNLTSPAPFNNSSGQYVVSAIAKLYNFDKTRTYSYKTISNTVLLIGSSANSTYNFLPNTTSNTLLGVSSNASIKITGLDVFDISKFEPDFGILELPQTNTATICKFANSTYGNSNDFKSLTMGREELTLAKGYIFSTTDEKLNGSSLVNNKSLNFDITFGSNNEFISPLLDEEDMHMHLSKYVINNNTLGENKRTGNAASKYVSKPVILAQNSEDLVVYVTAYRPYGTDVKVYAKIYNQEDIEIFDEKDWTLMELTGGGEQYSSNIDPNNKIEYKYVLPSFPIYSYEDKTAGDLIEGRFTGTEYSNIFTSTNTAVNTYISNTDIVRIYNPLFPNTSLVAVVTGSNTSSITVDKTLTYADTSTIAFISDGLTVEKVINKNTAFLDSGNLNIAKYFNNQLSAFKGFDSFSIKIVLTANSSAQGIPFVDDYRALATTV